MATKNILLEDNILLKDDEQKGNVLQQAAGAINEEGARRQEVGPTWLEQTLQEKGLYRPESTSRMGKLIGRGLGEVVDIARAIPQVGQTLSDVSRSIQELPREKQNEAVLNIGKQAATSIGTSIFHPVTSFKNRPVSTALDWSIALGTAKKIGSIQPIPKAIEKIKGVAGNTAAVEQSIATGIPKEYAERAVNRTRDVFRSNNFGNKAYSRVGQKIQGSIDDVGKAYGKAIKAETDSLRQLPTNYRVDTSKIIENMDKNIAEVTYGAGKGIPVEDLKKISDYADDIKKFRTPSELHRIKNAIQSEINFGKYEGNGQKVLSSLQRDVNNILREISLPYAQANDNFSALKEAEKGIKQLQAGKVRVGAGLKSIMNDPDSINALKTYNDVLPKDMQFWDEAMDVHTANLYNKAIRPGAGLVAAGGLGGAGVVAGLGGAFAPQTLGVGGLAAGLTSPKINQLLLRAGARGTEAARGIGQLGNFSKTGAGAAAIAQTPSIADLIKQKLQEQ